MALNTLYCGTNDVALRVGGTRSRLSIGTGGTAAIHPDAIGSFIIESSDYIDFLLSDRYGTFGWGTNAGGTKEVPSIIKQITSYFAAAKAIESLEMTVAPNKSEWTEALEKKAMSMLQPLIDGEKVIPGSTASETDHLLPKASDFVKFVKAEKVTLSGTTLVNLQFKKMLSKSEKVYGTVLDAGTLYVKGTDYQVYYYDQGTTGDIYGAIRRLGTSAIADGQDVFIDYYVHADSLFPQPSDNDVNPVAMGRSAISKIYPWTQGGGDLLR